MKELWLLIGAVSLILGSIGIFLPILPTTPFILLSAYSFSKSNNKVYNWLLTRKFVSKMDLSLQMTKSKKIMLNLFVDSMLIIYIFIFRSIFITISLVVVMLIKHFVFYKYVKTRSNKI